MKHTFRFLAGLGIALATISLTASTFMQADASVRSSGKAAPGFTLVDTYGKKHSLADLKGKYVVLEWLNHGCPFVKKHYSSGNMQSLQKKYGEKGVVWLSVVSSAPGKQGYNLPDDANALTTEMKAAPAAVLLDPTGEVGKLYDARTTPHMFVINPEGVIIYNGAIDDKRSTDVEDIPTSKNYVAAALDEAMSGKPVTVATTQPYGCSVKYP